MRYGDLVRFEPIESVIQLGDANQEASARHLVETFVISDRMADQLADVVIPQLQFNHPRDNKGVLVVGNYGTGKSHLMSVVSAVAEYPDLAASLGHPKVRDAAVAVAGRFKVARVEIGAVTRGLRDILLDELEHALGRWGVEFTFPPSNQLTNHKDVIVQAVAAFQEQHPDQGILLVVDELLDYLRNREERALILDLGFLRELGEVAALTPFRFVGGLQETLFDNPRFAFVADPLRRVRDRFEVVRIAREDIAFVVANRLLRKDDAQLAQITEHLRPFTPLYARLAERLDEFARLFPIHPAYIETFERVYVAEKREVLRTLSRTMAGLLDQEIPADQPGLVSYDGYWDVLRHNPSMRSNPDIAQVIDKSAVLEGRIESAYTRPKLLPIARRVVHALSVLRLTTDDVHAPLGATPEELRDNLCLHVPTPEPDAAFLLDQVRVALREIEKTVSGQYLSHNDANDQYYLDIRKDIDFAAKVRERGDFMEKGDLNRYFFDALRQVLALSDTTHFTGSQLWTYELPWDDRRVTRPGYLFFRAPDERTTAQPPRDFILYVLPPFTDPAWTGATEPDEVVFRLANLPPDFTDLVRRYAGARAMANDSATHRAEYGRYADDAFKRLRAWLADHLVEHLQVAHDGVTEPIAKSLGQTRSSASRTLEDLLRIVAAAKLAPLFAERYPEYPAFRRLSQAVTEDSRAGTAGEAIRALAGRSRTVQATAVLEALELAEGNGPLRPHESRFARRYLDALAAKPEGQVVNRGELIETVAGGVDKPIEKDCAFALEPEWVAVLLVALVANGDITLSLDGRESLDAAGVERAATISLDAIKDFRFFARPKTLPLPAWTAVFEGLGLQPGLIRDDNPSVRERAVQELQAAVARELERVARLQADLAQGVRLWNAALFTDNIQFAAERGAVVGSDAPAVYLTSAGSNAGLKGYKQFLETLNRFNTVGKLRNFGLSTGEVGVAFTHRAAVDRLEGLLRLVARLQPLTTYLAGADGNLPDDHPWTVQAAATRQRLLDDVRRLGQGKPDGAPVRDTALLQELETLKRAYVAAYAAEHARLTLGPKSDDRRDKLSRDPRHAALRTLSAIDIMDKGQLAAWNRALTALPTCREFHEGIIADTPICPNCRLRPAQHAAASPAEQTLDTLDRRLETVFADWHQALHANLSSETARQSRDAMTPKERGPIEAYLAQPSSSPVVPDGFAAAATTALRGISTVTLWQGDLIDALTSGGLPCTKEDLTARFNAFVSARLRGHDARTTRLTLVDREAHLYAVAD